MEKEKIVFENNIGSLDRPAWTQNDLHAYRNKYVLSRGSNAPSVLIDFYVKTHGLNN